tara:strand:- start:3576 stop:7841 length:4266 start_codon:yes stop_codon:yes gene_type:complete
MALFDTITIAGGGKTYTFSGIEVNDEEDLKVKVDGTSLNLNTPADYTISGSQITFSSTYAVTDGDKYVIYRDTKDDAARNQFYPSGSVRAQDLNKNFEQCLMAAEDKVPLFGAVMPDDINMGGNSITNLKDEYTSSTDPNAADADDAASHGWVRKFFFDVKAETRTGAEYDSEPPATKWPNDDLTVATTSAVNKFIDDKNDALLTNDIHEADGIKVTDNLPGTGQITIGLHDNSVDFSKIKDADIVTKAEQDADDGTIPSAYVNDDTKVPTMAAIIARHDNYVQSGAPAGNDHQIGQFWFDDANDKYLAVWNGTGWIGIASGGTFTTQPRLIWVDAANGDDSNDGHRVIAPMQTIKAAVASASDGDMVFVQPGVYQEICPIDLGSKKNVSVVGLSQRSVFVHPTPATETNTMWKTGTGSYLANMTWAGIKASGARGGNSLDPDSTYGISATQGWYVALSDNDGDGNAINFFKSPFIQNVTAFADSAIDNTSFDPNLNAAQPGFAGDETSAPTGGGMVVDGSVPASTSPIRSIVTDSFTFITLDGPGCLVTNGGYAQLVSTFGTFCHYHAKALNGGMINMSNCVTDFGRYGLIADGKSAEIFQANTAAVAYSAGDTQVEVGQSSMAFRGVANPDPNDHMLVEVTYADTTTELFPIDSVTVTSGTSKTITLARALTKAVNASTTLKFYLRSIITTGGHVFEFAGSGTNYLALPDKGGQAVEANQVKDLNNGKVYVSSTDHNGKFKVGPLEVDTDGNVIKYKGTNLPDSVLVDTTNADNITTGTLDAARVASLDASKIATGTFDAARIPGLDTSKLISGTLADARLPDKVTAATVANPASITFDDKGRVTAATAGQANPSYTYTVEADGNDAILKLTDTVNSTVDQVKVVAGTGSQINVANDGEFTISSPTNSNAQVFIAASAPTTGLNAGDLYWDTTTGESYIYYNDGTSSQWVHFAPQQAGTGQGTVTSVTAGTGLIGGTITTSGTLALANTAVTAGTYGNSTHSVEVSIDTYGRITGAQNIPIALDASDITSGTFTDARIPSLAATKVTSGTFDVARIPNLDAAKITTGTFDIARIPTLTNSELPVIDVAKIPNLNAAKITTGTFTASRIPRLNGDGSATSTYLESLAADLSPQLGANLDVNDRSITTVSGNKNIVFEAHGSGVVEIQGNTTGGNNPGAIRLNCEQGSHGITIKSPPHGYFSSYELELPNTNGSAGQYMTVDGSGKLYWDSETTYSLAGTNNSGAFRIQSTDSDGGSTAVELKAGTGITLDNSTANETTISVSATNSGVPTGSIQWFAGNTVPAGWLKCDGASYSTTAKAALYNAIGIMYGGGSGNFNVPDLRGEFIRGWDDGRGVDSGRGMGSAQTESIQSHAHSVFHASGGSGNNMAFGSGYGVDYSTGAAGGPETRPRNVALMAIIKE